MSGRTYRVIGVVCVCALLAVAGWYTFLREGARRQVSADFPTVEGVFPGSSVAVLGVDVGRVVAVEPRETNVRVTMSLRPDVELPADVHAYIMSPAVVSDRFVALGPAHTSGPTLDGGAVIPVERSHTPISWSQLSSSVDKLLRALGPRDANAEDGIGSLLSDAARVFGGKGEEFRTMVSELSQASELMVGNTAELGSVLDNVESLTKLVSKHRSTIEELARAVGDAASRFNAQQEAIADTIGTLSDALTSIKKLIDEHGDRLTGDLDQLATVSTNLVAHQRQLAETLDTLPLTLQNFSRAVTADDRLRIRLDISTNLNQFDATATLCEHFPLPLCSGKGLANPIPFPPHLPDALGLRGGG